MESEFGQAGFEAAQVARHHRLNISICADRRHALVFAYFGTNFRRNADGDVR